MVVRAVEEADPDDRALTLADRLAVALPPEDSDPTQWLIERAGRLRRKIFDSHPALATLDESLAVAGKPLCVGLARRLPTGGRRRSLEEGARPDD
jgi:hypothetical protein